MKSLSTVKQALKDIKKGKFIILVDDPSRENEGDFFIPAEFATPEKVNFMITEGKGLLCVAMESASASRLAIPLMVSSYENTESTKVNFGVSVNAVRGITSGISAYDRARTIQVLANPRSKSTDITRPGHIFPLVANEGGLKARQGHTEAAVALARLASLNPTGVLCEILKENGHMARVPDLAKIAERFGIRMLAITDLMRYMRKHPLLPTKSSTVIRTASAPLPTTNGTFQVIVYQSPIDKREHTAMLLGDVTSPMLTRIHSQCLTGDTLGSLTCDCGEQLQMSLEMIQRAGSGVLLYLDQEGRGIGLSNKIKAYARQARGLDTVEANRALGFAPDIRDYRIAADMLHDLGIREIFLLTNNPEKIKALKSNGIKVVKRVPLETTPTESNYRYLLTKKRKLGHRLNSV